MAEQTIVRELTEEEIVADVNQDYAEKYGFSDEEDYVFKAEKGLSEELVRAISKMKNEPDWMLEFRLKGYEHYLKRPLPEWGPDLHQIDFEDIYYYIKPTNDQSGSWDDVPDNIKNTFDKLGIPEAEQKFLSGVGAQYESEMIYHNIKKELEEQGVLFLGMDDAPLVAICEQVSAQLAPMLVSAVNFNSPGQVVLAGLGEAVGRDRRLADH